MLSRDKLFHPATAIALLALFLAIGGVSYAASQIGTSQIKNRAVTGIKIAPKAVTSSRLGSGAVISTKIAAGAVTSTKLGNNSVRTGNIAASQVTNSDLAANSVLSNNIGPLAVGTAQLGDASVTNPKIAQAAVTTSKLGDGAVISTKLALNAVTSEKIADNAVTTGDIAPAAVTSAQLAPGTAVNGTGTLISAFETVGNGATTATIATLPGFGSITAACAGGVATLSYVNSSGTAPIVQYAATNNGATDDVSIERANPPNNTTYPVPNASLGGIQTITWQLSYAPAHVATITTTAGASGTGCIITAQGTVS